MRLLKMLMAIITRRQLHGTIQRAKRVDRLLTQVDEHLDYAQQVLASARAELSGYAKTARDPVKHVRRFDEPN